MTKHAKLRLVLLLIVAAVLAAAYHQVGTETVMVQTAKNLLASLSADQKAKLMLDFGSELRTHWHFVPDSNYEQTYKHGRHGLTYKAMQPHQRRLADAFLSAGLSDAGFIKATTIMSLEDVLRIMEKDDGNRRDPEKYYFTMFGEPSAAGTWGYTIEGHHLSLNFTIKDGKLAASSPTFFGSNPHEVREGPRAGLRILGREEDLARELMKSLSAEQQKTALIANEAYRDIVTAASIRAKLDGAPQGLQVSKMNKAQAGKLMDLVAEYAHNLPTDVAEKRMKVVQGTAQDKIFFAWAGSVEQGKGDYYRVQGPTFLIEYDNTQNSNNHSHTVWRDFQGDFGFDVLAMHHKLFDHGLGVVKAD